MGADASRRTSSSLLERLRAADPDGWQRVTQLYGALVYSWCRRWGLQSHDAADVVQEVFRAVATNIDRFRRDRPGDSFRVWLRAITNNKIRDFWKKQSAQPAAAGGTAAQAQLAQLPAAEVDTDAEETSHLWRQALELVQNHFETSTWQAYWQSEVDGRATADVAADLGISPNAVRIARSRVRARLREEFADLIDGL